MLTFQPRIGHTIVENRKPSHPARPTRLCIVRHGETDWNAGRRIQGHIDIPLSAVGHAQARATGNALKDEGFAAIYSSDLTRARQTAEATAQLASCVAAHFTTHFATHFAKVPLQVLPELRERHYGIFEGLTYTEIEARYPQDYLRHKTREPLFAPPGGESLSALAERLGQAFDAIVHRHAGEAVAIFTHGGVLDILYRRAKGQPLHTPRDFTIPNTGINWIEVVDGAWTILSWAERDHLTGVRDEL